MAATAEAYVKLAQSLPPQLLRFFTRYQPRVINHSTSIAPSTNTDSDTNSKDRQAAIVQNILAPSDRPNPFRSQKNLETGRWHEPIYSLRRQADLVKMARANGVEELLPPTIKGTEARFQKRAKHGLRVKGTGVGQKIKGKLWERTMRNRLEVRKQAMEKMPELIEQWKELGRGRFWKKWPR